MLIIDAFNVLHTEGILPPHLADPGVPGLIRLIATSRYAGRDLTVVCDGGNGTADSGVRMDHAVVLYAGQGREADDVIEELIDRYHRGNPLTVVSTDARLKRAARRRRARSIDSATFLRHLVEDTAAPRLRQAHALREQVPLDPYSVRAWMREFALHEPPPAPANPPAPTDAAPPDPESINDPRSPRKPPKKRHNRADAASGSTLGSRLRIDFEAPGAPDPSEPEADPERIATEPSRDVEPPSAGQRESDPPPLGAIDPLLLQALEEWRDRLTLDDLDMQQWIPDATPLPDRHRRPPGG